MTSPVREILFGTGPIAWLQQAIGLGYPLPFRIFSLLGDTWGILLVVGVARWLFGRRVMDAVLGIAVAGALSKVLLSAAISQDRPAGPDIVVYEQLQVSSFPSGHVYQAVAPWGLLYALGCVPFGVAAALAALVSVGRLYLGAHFLGDVLAGVALAVALAWGFHRAWPRLYDWLAARGAPFFVAVALAAVAGAVARMLVLGPNPRRVEILGLVAGAVIALPLERRYLDPAPFSGSVPRRFLAVLVGVAGICAPLLLVRSTGGEAYLLGGVSAAAAAAWAVLGAPALLDRMRESGRPAAPCPGASRGEHRPPG